MPANPGQQKKREKQKKKREAAKRKHTPRQTLLDVGQAAVIREAALLPMGACFISAGWEDDDLAQPGLVSVLVTRRAPGNLVIPALALVDRTCLGVKNAFVAKPMAEIDLDGLVARIGEAHEGGMVPCEALVAQSVVFHAVDYARTLGFAPHKDFPEPIFGPRPEALLDTALARPARPVYVAGPDDNIKRILDQLIASVGPGNFDFTTPGVLDDEDEGEEEDLL